MFETELLSPRIESPAGAPFHLAAVGLFQSLGNFRWEQVPQKMSVHCVRSGRGEFHEDGAVWEVGPGDVFVFRPGRHYRYFDRPGEPWRYDFLVFEGAVEPVGSGVLPPCPFVTPPVPAAMWAGLERIVEAYRAERIGFAQAARMGWGFFETLAAQAPAAPSGFADEVRAFVMRQQVPFPTVGQIAWQFGIDRSTLYRRFSAETGVSVKSWLSGEQFRRSETLLQISDTPVQEVARICGFRDPLYFSKAFRSRYGLPPGQWRERNRTTGSGSVSV